MAIVRSHQPLLQSDFLFQFSKTGKQFKKYLQVLHDFTTKVITYFNYTLPLSSTANYLQVIRERKALLQLNNKAANSLTEDDLVLGSKKRLAFLDLLLEASKDGAVLTDQELQEEVDTFMFGVCTCLFSNCN